MLATKIISGIEKTPRVCGGEACLASTRIPVWLLEGMRRMGMPEAKILSCYPNVKRSHLNAAWEYVKHNKAEIDRVIRENDEA